MIVRLPLGRSIVFVCAVLAFVVAILPLRLAAEWLGLDARGFSARRATGSLWFGGSFQEARLGAISLGDVNARLQFLPLLAGRARLDLDRRGERLNGGVTVTRNGYGVDDVTGQIDASQLITPAIIETLILDDMSLFFANGACLKAEGSVRARLAASVPGFGDEALSGAVRCDGPVAVLPLTNASGTVLAEIRVDAGGKIATQVKGSPITP
jgi:general secretion pathway protein N